MHQVAKTVIENRPPPAKYSGVWAWLRENFFGSIWQFLFMLIGLAIASYFVWSVVSFALIEAVFTAENREACRKIEGACWPYIQQYFHQYIYGSYPVELRWRPDSVALFGTVGLISLIFSEKYRLIGTGMLFVIVLGLSLGKDSFLSNVASIVISFAVLEIAARLKASKATGIVMLIVFPLFAFVMLTGGNFDYVGYEIFNFFDNEPSSPRFWAQYTLITTAVLAITLALTLATGGNLRGPAIAVLGIAGALALALASLSFDFGLKGVETHIWGGLLITLVIAVTGIVISLPIGIILALGRRSKMPVIRMICVIFIEFWRGVPLITVLFMANVMLPFFLPQGVNFDGLLRVLVGVALFSSAYMAEVVRGGLQAISRGQYEGAQALGLTYPQMTQMIILPQALKLVIPGIVNTFIGLFKDTTLVSIVGIFDVLGIAQRSFTDPTWSSPTQSHTGYLVVAIIFFVFCFAMSRYSIYIEHKLDTGHKR